MKGKIMVRIGDRHKRIKDLVKKYGIIDAVRIDNEDTKKSIAMLKNIGYTAEYAHFYTVDEVKEIVEKNIIHW